MTRSIRSSQISWGNRSTIKMFCWIWLMRKLKIGAVKFLNPKTRQYRNKRCFSLHKKGAKRLINIGGKCLITSLLLTEQTLPPLFFRTTTAMGGFLYPIEGLFIKIKHQRIKFSKLPVIWVQSKQVILRTCLTKNKDIRSKERRQWTF